MTWVRAVFDGPRHVFALALLVTGAIVVLAILLIGWAMGWRDDNDEVW